MLVTVRADFRISQGFVVSVESSLRHMGFVGLGPRIPGEGCASGVGFKVLAV